MYILESEIPRIFNERNWAVARNYHQKGVVENMEIHHDHANHCYEIFAVVEAFSYRNNVNITLMETGIIHQYSCECRYCDEEYACGHVGAVLLFLNDITPSSFPYYYEKRIEREKELQDWLIQRQIEQSKTFLNTYKRMSEGEFQANLLSNKVKMFATLDDRNHALTISYKLGNEKYYVLKNILTFLDAVQKRAKVYYGKNLNFIHHPDAFDETAKLTIQFLQRYRNEHISELEYGYMDKRNLVLDHRSLDDFYDFYSEEGNGTINCSFAIDELDTIPLHIKKDELGFLLTTPLNFDRIYKGHSYWYLYEDDCFHRFQKEIFDTCTYLLEQLKQQRQILIEKDDMREFCTYVYPQIEDHVTLEGDSIEEYQMEEPKLSCFVDMEENGDLSIRIYARRDALNCSIFDAKSMSSILIDRCKMLVESYADVIDQDAGVAYIHADSHLLMGFLQDGLSYLDGFCDVFVSDTIQQMNAPKSVKFQIGIRMENNLLAVDVNSVHIPQDEIYAVLKSYRRKKKYHRLKNGDLIYLEQENIKEINDMMEDLNLTAQDFSNGSISLPIFHSFELDELTNNTKHAQIIRNATFEETLKHMRHIQQDSFALPEDYEQILRDYQVFGFQWLKTMSAYGFGGILADDMGLGKTLQMICLLEDEKNQHPDSISLIITPASLIFNWQEEIQKFSKKLHCLCVHGSASKRQGQILKIQNYDVIVTSYDYIRRDHECYKNHTFAYLVLDEAQYIKNHTTKNASAVKTLTAQHRFALTGTPIENSLAELWSIFDFLMPGYLYNYHYFRKHYEREIVKYHNEERSVKLKQLVEPFILRRIKRDVLKELPDKIEKVQYLEFSEEEEKLYMANLVQINKDLQKKLNMEGFDRFQILAMMTKLRQICCDARLLYENIDTCSSKLEGCMDLILSAKANDKKVLLFSSFTSLLDLMEDELVKQDITYLKLTGETSKEARREAVNRFQNKEADVFLISLKAGGTGLNLTVAEVVIHFDPWWNMSAQNQATDRAYRIGQTQNVQVYKLIMKNSIEEKILKLQEKKMDLSNTFTQGSEGSITSMSEEDILSLFQ